MKRNEWHRKDASSTPTWHRMPDHCPDSEVGGSHWMVTYRGEPMGFIFSTWGRDGVHFRIRGVSERFATRGEAVTHLMDLYGIDLEEPIDYDIHKGPRGGGEELLDRRY